MDAPDMPCEHVLTCDLFARLCAILRMARDGAPHLAIAAVADGRVSPAAEDSERRMTMREIVDGAIVKALEAEHGNATRAAKALGISRDMIYARTGRKSRCRKAKAKR